MSEFSLNRNAITTALAGYVPYTGATANLNLGLFKLVDNASIDSISPDLRVLYASSGNKTLNWSSGELLSTPTTTSIDWINSKSYYPNGISVSHDFGVGILYESNGSMSIDYNNWTLYSAGVPIFNWQSGLISDNFGGNAINTQSRQLLNTTGNYAILDWGNQSMVDGSGVKAMDFSTAYRQLYDFGGSYTSVDFGNYGLFNIGVTNSVPLLDWSTGAGGSVKIYYGPNNSVVGDFTNCQLYDLSGNKTLDWGIKQGYDNTNALSIDWDYHTLHYAGETTLDWQSKTLKHDGGGGSVNSIEWGNFKCMNTGGFTSIDYGNHQLYDIAGAGATLSGDYSDRKLFATDGTTVILNWQTQQTTAITGATVASGTGGNVKHDDTFDGYTIDQVVAALRVYGLLA